MIQYTSLMNRTSSLLLPSSAFVVASSVTRVQDNVDSLSYSHSYSHAVGTLAMRDVAVSSTLVVCSIFICTTIKKSEDYSLQPEKRITIGLYLGYFKINEITICPDNISSSSVTYHYVTKCLLKTKFLFKILVVTMPTFWGFVLWCKKKMY